MFKLFNISIFCAVCFFLSACQQKSKIDTSEFILSDDLQIELMASEPNLISPVAMVEDEKNRFWLVEMPGYMRDIEGSHEEDVADGRIVILEDSNENGQLDKRSVFMDSLLNPRALCLVYGGLLFTDGTALKWTSIENDQPGMIEVVDSFYVIGGNIEHQPNGLLYNLDNWIYSAKSNVRYQKKNGQWQKEATSFRGQWGISMHQDGRLLYNNNSVPLAGDYAMPNFLLDNPYLQLKNNMGELYTDNFSIFPVHASSVNRGYQPGVIDDSTGKVLNYTSACAPNMFYGSKLGERYFGNAFVCTPEGNLISSYIVDENAFELNAKRIYPKKEFLVSTDETFRPVNLHAGFDGALYVVDLRKGIIQHRAYMSNYLREKIVEKGLEQINGNGRIYKISSKTALDFRLNLADIKSKELPQLLQHSNLNIRMFAQKKIIAEDLKTLQKDIIKVAKNTNRPFGQIHSMWTLHGMDLLDAELLLNIASSTKDERVKAQVLILSRFFPESLTDFTDFIDQVLLLKNPKLDYLLAHLCGKEKDLEKKWWYLANRYADQAQFSEALVSGIAGKEQYFLQKLSCDNESKPNLLCQVLQTTLSNQINQQVKSPRILTVPHDDDRTNGLKIFKTYCASCHGMDGLGQKQVAPSLASSKFIKGNPVEIASIVLNGYDTGSKDYRMLMPAYINDPKMSDRDIVDVISYLKSTFKGGWSKLKIEQVDSLRQIELKKAL